MKIYILQFILIFLFTSCQKEETKIIISLHNNGQPHEVLFLKNPIIKDSIGIKKIYRPDGQLKCEGPYISGLRNGLWKCFYPDETLEWETTFVLGKEEGEINCKFQDGSWKRLYANNGILNGPTTEFQLDNGNYFYINGQYLNGLETGIWTTTDQEGRKIIQKTYVEGKLFGDFITYHSNGNIESKGTCIGKDTIQSSREFERIIMTDTIWYYNESINGKIDSLKILN